MPCMHYQTCPLFKYFSSHPILNLWRTSYCDKPDNTHCVRFQNTSKGLPNPMSMLPNGNTVATAPLTLLHAIAKNRTHLVKNILVNIEVDINYQDIKGLTALMIAAALGHIKILEILLQHGAKTDIKNYNNETAYDLAMIKRQNETAALLRRTTQ